MKKLFKNLGAGMMALILLVQTALPAEGFQAIESKGGQAVVETMEQPQDASPSNGEREDLSSPSNADSEAQPASLSEASPSDASPEAGPQLTSGTGRRSRLFWKGRTVSARRRDLIPPLFMQGRGRFWLLRKKAAEA